MKRIIGRLVLFVTLAACGVMAQAQQTEANVLPSPVRAEISLSNSEQQPFPNQHKYKLGILLTHDLSRVAVPAVRRQDFKGR